MASPSLEEKLSFTKKVSSSFIGMYYKILSGNPDQLHNFYSHKSILSIGGAGIEEENIQDPKEIVACLTKHRVCGAYINLESGTFASVPTANGDIAFMVTGEMGLAQSTEIKPFVHTFVLAGAKPFYVEAEMLRFLPAATPAPIAAPAPALAPIAAVPAVAPVAARPPSPKRAAVPPPAPVEPAKQATPVCSPVQSPVLAPVAPAVPAVSSPVKEAAVPPMPLPRAAASPVTKPVAAPARQQQSRSRAGSSNSAKSTTKPVAAKPVATKQQQKHAAAAAAAPAKPVAPPAPETPKKPSGPISWASIASKPKPVVASPVAAPVESAPASAAASPATKKEEPSPATAGATASATPVVPKPAAAPAAPVPTSVIFVKGFPVGTKNAQLNMLFKQFGALERVEIFELTRTGSNTAYAYITFKEQASATAAVAMPGLQLDGGTLAYALKTGSDKMPVGARPPRQNNYRNNGGNYRDNRGPRRDVQGGRNDNRGPRRDGQGGRNDNRGPRRDGQGGPRAPAPAAAAPVAAAAGGGRQ